MHTTRTGVLFVVPSLKVRGAERMMVNIINGLNPHKISAHLLSLSDDNPLAQQINPETVRFVALPRKTRFDLRPALGIRQIILEQHIQTIVALDIFSYLFIWRALWRTPTSARVFISIHNSKWGSLKDLIKNLLIARLVTGNDRFVSVCQAQARYWSKTYRIPKGRFLTIYNGVDTNWFCPEYTQSQKTALRRSLNIPEDAFVILQVASLTAEKNHEGALAALKQLLDAHPGAPFRLVLVGQGPAQREKQIRELAQRLGVSESVRFLGLQQDVKPYYEIADLFTLTSNSMETFSVAALEAMSMGLPCVITDIGGACEMIADGVNGYLIHPVTPETIAQKWLAVFNNPHVFPKDRVRGYALEHFSLAECIQKYSDVFVPS